MSHVLGPEELIENLQHTLQQGHPRSHPRSSVVTQRSINKSRWLGYFPPNRSSPSSSTMFSNSMRRNSKTGHF